MRPILFFLYNSLVHAYGSSISAFRSRPRLQTLQEPTALAEDELTFEEFFSQAQRGKSNISLALELSLLRYIELDHPVAANPNPDCPDVARQSYWNMGIISNGRHIIENATAGDDNGFHCDSAFFSGTVKDRENIVFDVLLFSFELDILELRLHTLNSSVDKFVIVEFDVNHHGDKKILVFGRNQNSSRFAAFSSKIIYIPVLESSSFVRVSLENDSSVFKTESSHTRAAIAAFQHYVNHSEYADIANSADRGRLLYHFSHADEIPHPSNLRKIKYCQVKDSSVLPLHNALWFVMSDLRYAFKSDAPAPRLPYTLVTMNGINVVFPAVDAIRDVFASTNNFLVGGWHMAHMLYPPFTALKELFATESRRDVDIRALKFGKLNSIQADWLTRMVPVKSLAESERVTTPHASPLPSWQSMLYAPPAYAICNRGRYEVWFTREDRRAKLKIPAL